MAWWYLECGNVHVNFDTMSTVSHIYSFQFSLRRRLAYLWCRLIKERFASDTAVLESKRILLVATGLLGDTVMCTPVMAEARRIFPKARIVALVNSRNRDLLEPSSWFDDFLVYDGSPFPYRPRNVKLLHSLAGKIRKEEFDLAMVLLGENWIPLLYRAGIPRRVGPEGFFAGLLSHVYSIGPPNAWGPNERLNAIRSIGAHVDSVQPQVIVSDEARLSLRRKLRQDSFPSRSPLVLFHPFAASSTRTLSVEKIMNVSRKVIQELGADVILIGGERHRKILTGGNLARVNGLFNYVGRLTVQETCALMELTDVVLTTDSGPMHLAGALERPTVALFRAIRPEYAHMYPSVVPVFWDSGTECLKGCWWESWTGCRETPCRQLERIRDEKIIEAVSKQVTAHHTGIPSYAIKE